MDNETRHELNEIKEALNLIDCTLEDIAGAVKAIRIRLKRFFKEE